MLKVCLDEIDRCRPFVAVTEKGFVTPVEGQRCTGLDTGPRSRRRNTRAVARRAGVRRYFIVGYPEKADQTMF